MAALRDAAAALSLAACVRLAGVTQTASPPNASRQTKPCLQSGVGSKTGAFVVDVVSEDDDDCDCVPALDWVVADVLAAVVADVDPPAVAALAAPAAVIAVVCEDRKSVV